MANFFEPGPLTSKVKYPEYFLADNPFPLKSSILELMAEEDRANVVPQEMFQRLIGYKEINHIVQKMASFLAEETEKTGRIMVVPDTSAPSFLNIFIVSSYLRKLVIEKENLRIFSALVPFPFISLEPVKGISKMLIERFLEDDFLFCLHSLLYRIIKEKVAAGMIDLAGIDLKGLLKSMRKTKGKAIDELFFPTEEEMAEAAEEEKNTAERNEQQETEKIDEGEKAQASEVAVKEPTPEEIEAKEKRAAQRQALADLIEESFKVTGYDEYVQEAIFIAMEIGLSQALKDLKTLLRREYAVKGLLKFADEFFRKAVAVIDMFDGWDYLSQREQEQFFDGLDGICRDLGEDLQVIIVSPPDLVERANRYYHADTTVTFHLETSRMTEPAYDEPETIKLILQAFLEADGYRANQKDALAKKKLENTFPFVQSGIEELIKQFDGATIQIIEAAHDLIEAGSKAGYPVIDKAFVSKNIGNRL